MPEDSSLSFLDKAYSLWLKGEFEQALANACSILSASIEDPGAAYLVARILAEKNRGKKVAEVIPGLVDRNVRRGNLPGACLAARLGVDIGLDGKEFFGAIADAFGKGSPRVGDVAQRPPALPSSMRVNRVFSKLTGTALLDAAEKTLTRLLDAEDPLPVDTAVPMLPLYGELEPKTLKKLLALQEVRVLDEGETAIEQGDEGIEAFTVARGILRAIRINKNGETILAALGPGAIFGEMALVSRAPRAASIRAAEPCLLLVMGKQHLEILAAEEPMISRELVSFCRGRMVSNLIRHSEILSAIKPEKRRELIDKFEIRGFESGELLVRQGQNRAGLFLIASGSVEVTSNDSEGDKVIIAQLGPGEVVGEISLVLRRPATADVVAIVPTIAMELTQERFHEVIREHPSMLGELYELATKREEETRSVVAQKAVDVDDIVLV
jgi:CRP-like cAMP-binding protein